MDASAGHSAVEIIWVENECMYKKIVATVRTQHLSTVMPDIVFVFTALLYM